MAEEAEEGGFDRLSRACSVDDAFASWAAE